MILQTTKRKKQEGEEPERQAQAYSQFTQPHIMPAMFVCGLSADTDRNFNYFIREGK